MDAPRGRALRPGSGQAPSSTRGRGTAANPPNRFEPVVREREWNDPDDPAPRTMFYRDRSRSALSANDSPDIAFDASVNPYRGCEHGCAYCYARPTHEYLGLSAGLDFETKIFVKEDAPLLLRRELAKAAWTPKVVALSGVTDCYQPAERRLRITRACLEVLAEFRNPALVVTKNELVARDADVLADLARARAAAVFLSVTTLDAALAGALEPRASAPARRLAAIAALARAGVPVGVMVAPVVPGLTDHELPAIVRAAADAGATFAGYTVLRLPHGVKELFTDWLERHQPGRAEKVLNRVRDLRDGKLNDARFFSRFRGEGPFAEQIRILYDVACKKAGLSGARPVLSTAAFRHAGGAQLALFG